MKARILLVSMVTTLCLWSCSDKNNVIDEPKIPLQIEPEPVSQPETRHSYTPVQLDNTQQAINIKLQEFSWKLFKEVYANRESGTNLMISPISLEVDLGMFINGLEGETLQEVLKTMGLENYTKVQINDFFKTMIGGIEKADEAAVFKSANAFWYNQHFTANADFLSAISSNYAAKAEAVNFSDPQTVTKINAWCAEQTNDRIKDMLQITTEADIFHLMNAVYFKASWMQVFEKEKTSTQPFHYANGTTANVDMMHQIFETSVVETDKCLIAVKPFVDNSFRMLFMQPKEGVDMVEIIPDVMESITSFLADKSSMDFGERVQLDLYAPKFTAEYSEKHLFDYMKNINPSLDFERVDLKKDYILFDDTNNYDVMASQKTFFLMDEVGAEAAAVTDIAGFTSVPRPVTIRLDRPFFYAIVESNTQCPLFIGYYGN